MAQHSGGAAHLEQSVLNLDNCLVADNQVWGLAMCCEHSIRCKTKASHMLFHPVVFMAA
jgi:hypothetical protein